MRIGDRERIAAKTVASQEIPFKIHAPKLIGRSDHRERLGTGCGAPFLPLWVGETGPVEDLAYGAGRWPAHVRAHALQTRLELPRPPGRKPLS